MISRIVCWLQGHDCVGYNPTLGWAQRKCRRCQAVVIVHYRAGS